MIPIEDHGFETGPSVYKEKGGLTRRSRSIGGGERSKGEAEIGRQEQPLDD